MNKIVYIVPYFGKLRSDFALWVVSCAKNPTIDWLIYTDDKENEVLQSENIPDNIIVRYMSFKEMCDKIQKHFEFKIELPAPYKLCDYRPAYGEVFQDEISEYDFWGHCDMDLIFGNIREFLTDDVLRKYDRIGRWGHSILYRNTPESNARYRSCIDGIINYIEVFQEKKNLFFDETGMLEIYNALGVKTYGDLKIADLHPSWWKFEIFTKDPEERKRNKHRVFAWEDGMLNSYTVYNKNLYKSSFMYVHFLRRPMSLYGFDKPIKKMWIIPNEIHNVSQIDPSVKEIIKVSKNRMDKYWISFIKRKWRQATPKKVYTYVKGRIRGRVRRMLGKSQ